MLYCRWLFVCDPFSSIPSNKNSDVELYMLKKLARFDYIEGTGDVGGSKIRADTNADCVVDFSTSKKVLRYYSRFDRSSMGYFNKENGFFDAPLPDISKSCIDKKTLYHSC